jgi:hypothetical protein
MSGPGGNPQKVISSPIRIPNQLPNAEAIGPRQIVASAGLIKKPLDKVLMLYRSIYRIISFPSSFISGDRVQHRASWVEPVNVSIQRLTLEPAGEAMAGLLQWIYLLLLYPMQQQLHCVPAAGTDFSCLTAGCASHTRLFHNKIRMKLIFQNSFRLSEGRISSDRQDFKCKTIVFHEGPVSFRERYLVGHRMNDFTQYFSTRSQMHGSIFGKRIKDRLNYYNKITTDSNTGNGRFADSLNLARIQKIFKTLICRRLLKSLRFQAVLHES